MITVKHAPRSCKLRISKIGWDATERQSTASIPIPLYRVDDPDPESIIRVITNIGAPIVLQIEDSTGSVTLSQQCGEACVFSSTVAAAVSSESPFHLIEYKFKAGAPSHFANDGIGEVGRSLSQLRPFEDPILYHLSRAMAVLLRTQQITSYESDDSFAQAVMSRLIEGYRPQHGDPQSSCSGGLSPSHVRKVDFLLSGTLREGISVAQLAAACGLSAGHFAKVFRQTFGKSVHRHVLMLRVERAKSLLRTSSLSLCEVGFEIGYADQTTFTESFAKVMGIAPGRYRRQFARNWD